MSATLLAALSAFGFAAAAVSARQGLQRMSALGGFVISLPAGLAVVLLMAAFDVPEAVSPRALAFIALAGLCGTVLGRLLTIMGLQQLPTPVHIPLQSSTQPLLALVGGLVLFGEHIGLLRIAGAGTIVVGIWFLTRMPGAAELVRDPGAFNTVPVRTPSRRSFLLPLAAGAAYGAADLATKQAMLALPHPAFGAALSVCIGTVVWGTVLGASRAVRARTRFGRGKRWFVLHGALTSLAVVIGYSALERGDVSVVGPIFVTQPAIVLLLSAAFLRRVEVVTARVVAGSLLVVAGAVLVSVS